MPTTHLLEHTRQEPVRASDDVPAHTATAAALLAGLWSAAFAFDRPLHLVGFLILGLLAAGLARLLRPSRGHGGRSAYLVVLGGVGALLLVLCAVSLDPVWILPAAALGLALGRVAGQ